jgi:hypothetical protein
VEPAAPSKPKTLLNIMLGFVVGTVLGLAAVFLLELLDRRVRSATTWRPASTRRCSGTLQPWQPSHLLGGRPRPARAAEPGLNEHKETT